MNADGRREIRRAGVDDATDVAQLLHDFNTEYDDPTPPVAVLAERDRRAAGRRATDRDRALSYPPLALVQRRYELDL